MEEDKKFTPLSEVGEFKLISHLAEKFKLKHPSTLKGIGDDAAVLDFKDKETVISTDMLVEGVHIDLTYMPLKHVGYKAVSVNLSDICAMNVLPTQITFSMAVSNRFSLEALTELYEGVHAACANYDIDLIGGDTTSSNKGLILSVTALGAADKQDIVFRNTAQENDLLCVSGNLGAASLGLMILEREKQVFLADNKAKIKLEPYSYLVERLLKPEPRYDVVKTFKELGLRPTSMIDISDGLSSEALHLATQSHLSVTIYEAKLPVDPLVYETALELKIDPYVPALNGGDEYELLFTLKQEDYHKIKDLQNISVIGFMSKPDHNNAFISKDNKSFPLQALGWNSFKK